jgi:putative transposase
MAYTIPTRPLGSRFTTFLRAYVQDGGLPFASVLTEEQIQEAATAEGGMKFGSRPATVFTVATTLWALVGQFLAGQKSCVAAVARVIAFLAASKRRLCSAATGAYCKARVKLSEAFLRRLTYQVAIQLEDQAPSSWSWHNRRALLVDGTTVTAPDTPANQQAYPQSRSQRPGMGFPTIRLVLLLAFATAGVIGAVRGQWRGKGTGEPSLFRQLLDQLRKGDVVVADRYYCSYFMIAMLQAIGVDAAFRLHHLRDYDFRRGRHLGHADHIVEWRRPQRPNWMDEATYASMPTTLTVRELRFRVDVRGCRSPEIIMATTLLDHKTYSKDDVADLFHYRWHIELDLRSIKQTLGMEMLSCLSPAMLHKEIWAYLLGYNLARKAAAQAAWEHHLTPRQISFAGTVQALEAFAPVLIAGAAEQLASLYAALFNVIASHIVGNRPDRVEPRRLKRRIDKYPMLRNPRAQERDAILNGKG